MRRLLLLASFLFVISCSLLLVSCAQPPPLRHSVLVISADSLRVDRLRPWNPDEDVPPVPNLTALAASGTRYANAWATSPWTAPSMVSVFTGLYPPSHGVVYRDDTTPPDLPTLSRMLGGDDYALGNFSFFSQISYFRNLGLGEAIRGLTHDTVAKSFRAWLNGRQSDQPFFAWVHLLEAHLPYGATGYQATEVQMNGSSGLEASQLDATVPVGSARFAPRDRERIQLLYDRDVRALDHTVGRIMKTLDHHGLRESTLVIFVADHGEELLDHGWVGHASTAVEAHLWPEILRIPLIVAGPGVPAGQVRDELVQQVDILPSVMGLLGRETPEPIDGIVLPGLQLESRWPWHRSSRTHAFFDTSPGGNLTPQDRRGDRLQGVSDGHCIVAQAIEGDHAAAPDIFDAGFEASGTGDGCADPTAYVSALERWQADQARQRLALLTREPTRQPPSDDEIETYAEALDITQPMDGVTVRWEDGQGQLALAWEGTVKNTAKTRKRAKAAEGAYWLEYRLEGGLGVVADVAGLFPLDQRGVVFGPVPKGFWNDLAAYSPFRVRVLDEAASMRSPWITFEVERVN